MPRSESLPNKVFNTEEEQYQFIMDRDFKTELQLYFQCKQEKDKKERARLARLVEGGEGEVKVEVDEGVKSG